MTSQYYQAILIDYTLNLQKKKLYFTIINSERSNFTYSTYMKLHITMSYQETAYYSQNTNGQRVKITRSY